MTIGDGGASASGRRGGDSPDPRGHRGVEDRHDPARGLAARRSLVVGRRQPSQGEEELGGHDEHGERRLEGDPARHQAQAELDGDERHRHRCAPLQHQARLERRPQHPHRGVAVAEADLADPPDLLAAPAVRPERRQAPEHVAEVALHPAEVGGPCRRRRCDAGADQAQQQDQDRAGDQQHDGRGRVDQRDDDEDDDGDDAGQQRRRPERADPRLDRLRALDQRGRDLAAPLAGQERRPEVAEVRRHPPPDRPDQADRRPPGQRLTGGAHRGPDEHDHHQRHEDGGRVRGSRGRRVRDTGRARDGDRQQGGERDGQERRPDRERDAGEERPARDRVEREQPRFGPRRPPGLSSRASRPWSCLGRSSTRRRYTPG